MAASSGATPRDPARPQDPQTNPSRPPAPRGWQWAEIPGLMRFLVPDDAEIQPVQDQGGNPQRRIRTRKGTGAKLANGDQIALLAVDFDPPALSPEEAREIARLLTDPFTTLDFVETKRDVTRVSRSGILQRELLLRVTTKKKVQIMTMFVLAGGDRAYSLQFIGEGDKPMQDAIVDRVRKSLQDD